jgi:hypothetical protein
MFLLSKLSSILPKRMINGNSATHGNSEGDVLRSTAMPVDDDIVCFVFSGVRRQALRKNFFQYLDPVLVQCTYDRCDELLDPSSAPAFQAKPRCKT